ncbi:MAG: sialidase family protein [Chryseolinea sp.]
MMKSKIEWIVTIGLMVGYLNASGQYTNVKIDEASRAGQFTNPTVAISRKDVNNIFVTGFSDMIYTSADGGVTWEKSKITTPEMVIDDRILLSDSRGTLYSIQCIKGNDGDGSGRLVCLESKDKGKTWDAPVQIGTDATKAQSWPSASFDNRGNIFVTWTQYDKFESLDSTCHSKVYLSSSSNGKKWSKPVELSQVPGDCMNADKTVTGAVAAIGPDGKMFATWYGAGKLYLDRSLSSGMWLENDILINRDVAPFNLQIKGHAMTTSLPQLGIDQSKGSYHGCMYVAWADERNGKDDCDVYFMRSNNHGDNWSSPLRLGSAAKSTHQYAPKLTLDPTTGMIYVLYYDRGAYEDEQTDVFLSYSSDSGANFKALKISETPFVPDDKSNPGLFLNISAYDGVVVPVWSRVDAGVTSILTASIKATELIKPVESKVKKKK